jgi:FkbM family methyltransferase
MPIKYLFIFLLIFLPSQTQEQKSYAASDATGIPLDVQLAHIFKIHNGIFIEVGAHDGIFSSNTKLLEESYNWTGILIEPSENLFSKLCKNRPKSRCFNCALGSFEEHNSYKYGDFDGHPMSSFTQRINRPATTKVLIRSLQSILDECNIQHVNFFSLDTEGYEWAILQGIDFNKTTFDYLLIEIYKHEYDAIIKLLANNGYELIRCLSNYNLITNPGWDGTHNDYLFKRKNLVSEAIN